MPETRDSLSSTWAEEAPGCALESGRSTCKPHNLIVGAGPQISKVSVKHFNCEQFTLLTIAMLQHNGSMLFPQTHKAKLVCVLFRHDLWTRRHTLLTLNDAHFLFLSYAHTEKFLHIISWNLTPDKEWETGSTHTHSTVSEDKKTLRHTCYTSNYSLWRACIPMMSPPEVAKLCQVSCRVCTHKGVPIALSSAA